CRFRLLHYGPREAGGAALVPSGILGLDREGVVAQAESGVTVGARTGAERTAIELAQEAHSCLGVAELEAGAGLVGRVAGHRGNTRSRRGCGVDRPRKAGGAALVASDIL